MGAKRARGMAEDPLAPLAGMALAAMLLLGSASGEPASDRPWEEPTEEATAASSAVGKVYTPRLVLGGSPGGVDGHEAPTPSCAAADVRVSYRVAALDARGVGT